jgi:hypothetical protein
MKLALSAAALFVLVSVAVLYVLGTGILGKSVDAGTPNPNPLPLTLVVERSTVQKRSASAVGATSPKQILFGDLHVHSTYSTDAFLMSLPLNGGDGVRPVSDACDFARYCSALDFWSINDHALALTTQRWRETVEAIRACNEVSGDPQYSDVTAFLGWEWTQVGTTPDNHYGHKNVVLRHTDDARIPRRHISAGFPRGASSRNAPPKIAMGALALAEPGSGSDLVRYFNEMLGQDICETGVPVRELPEDCTEQAPTPEILFEKLDDWGVEALVIPHGTTWGYYTPLGTTWAKQLTPKMHDPQRQTLIEVYSGHGNSEEYRPWRGVDIASDGTRTCPRPTADYLPSCWQAGEIIRARCLEADEAEATCAERAEVARDNYLDADNAGHHTVPGQVASEWLDSGQCRDCFLPSFNYRPGNSVQYMMAQGRESEPQRFRFGFLASSDNHSARPGTGYKEYDRKDMTEARFANFGHGVLGISDDRGPLPESKPLEELDPNQFFGTLETERQGSFFLTGGLVAAHAQGRGRDAIWDALSRREVYGTSGPRILLWFDLVNPPGTRGAELPMGSAVTLPARHQGPIFRVRAVGSFEQKPGCPRFARGAVGDEGIQHLCGGECYHPSNERRLITRVEVVRIRPQLQSGEPIEPLIEDPWRVIPCEPDATGCRVTFSDPDFRAGGRDALYYVRAIESPSLAVNASGIGCQGVPLSDDCLGEVEERAWSSPIFVDHASHPRQ